MLLRYSDHAKADIQEIAAYIALDNAARAYTFAHELYALCEAIVSFPSKYPLIREGKVNIRRAVYKSYNIYYTVNTEHVLVLRILHSARNTQSLL